MTNQEISEFLKLITQEGFSKAMKDIDENEHPKTRRIKYYKAVFKETGKLYAPPLIIDRAYYHSVNKSLPEGFFKGIGKNSVFFKFLEGNGFNVLETEEITSINSMTNKQKYDILNRLTREMVLDSMLELDNTEDNVVGNNYYYEVLNPNSDARYPVRSLVENTLERLVVDIPDGLFDRPGIKDPVYKTLKKLGFDYAVKEREKYFLKLSKTQDLRNEIYIPKKYTGKSNKYFQDPRIEDPEPIKEEPHLIKIQMKWEGYDDDYIEYELKTFIEEFHGNSDTRIAGTPKKELNSIILFSKDADWRYVVKIVNEGDAQYEKLKEKLNGKSYLLIDEIDKIKNMEQSDTKYPLNQILYGPPGTGKTYSTITKALDIIGVKYADYEEAQELFQNELGKRIEFVTMHQSFSYEDFVQGLKPGKTEDGKGILFEYRSGVFMNICERADEESLINDIGSSDTSLTDKLLPSFMLSFEEQMVYDMLKEKVFNGTKVPQYVVIDYFNKKIGKKYCKAWRDKFDFILEESTRVGYQPDKFRSGEMEEFIEYSNKFKLMTLDERKDKLLKEWIESKSEVIAKKNDIRNYVIILDEINRANISRVFGELIALIEEDKRDGKLTATLPSGDPFTVPSNLHIIGTMNTADKSIALVDIALRRRFKFVPMYPKTDILEEVLGGMELSTAEISLRVHVLKTLNRIIRSKKSVDFEIGHSYFMSNHKLEDIMNDQVLPLLNEYFMYDLRVVKELLEKQQKDKDGNKIPRIGISLDPDEFKERGLLKVVSVTKVADTLDEDKDDENDSSEDDA